MRPALRRAAIARVAGTAFRTGLTALLTRAAGRGEPRVPVLCFHRVNDDRDPFFPAMPTAVFERQMAYVARAYRVVGLDEMLDRTDRGELPGNALVVTFDDGYRDNLTHAAPILARHRIAATVFLSTGFIGTAAVPWFDRVAGAFKTATAGAFASPWGAVLPLGSQAERLAALDATLGHLKRLPHEQLERTADAIAAELAAAAPAKNAMLGWDDVHALRGLGCAIGAHTVTHPILSRMSPAGAADEIARSRRMVEAGCGVAPRAFAYPNGQPDDYSSTTMRLAREAGFDAAVTTRFGLNGRLTPRLELRRGGPAEHHLATFALKLAWYRLTMEPA